MNNISKNAFAVMDNVLRTLPGGSVDELLTELTLSLQQLRNSDRDEWDVFATGRFLTHPLLPIIHQDPFSRHAFTKPRKYDGDADLIDYVYGYRKPAADTTPIGKQIFDYTMTSPAPVSVKARLDIIAAMIDELAKTNQDLSILSIASGHVREADISQAINTGSVKEFFALDQDAITIETVRRAPLRQMVIPVHSPIRALFTHKIQFHDLDFVYSAGLFDYLPQNVAVKLTAIMFETLKPGGKLLVPNFAPCLRDIAYMETFMQWRLIYRDEDEMANLTSQIPSGEIAETRLFRDSPGNVIYLEINKQ